MKFSTAITFFLASTITEAKNLRAVAPVPDFAPERQLVAQCLSSELVSNGGFESSACSFGASYMHVASGNTCMTNWAVGGDGVDLIGSLWQHHSGSRSVDLNHAAQGSIKQTIATEAGKQYKLTFWMAGNPDRDQANVKDLTVVHAGGATETFEFDVVLAGSTRSNMQWVERCMVFTASSSSTEIEFEGGADDQAWSAVVDDISVCEVAPGATCPSGRGGMAMDPHVKKWNGDFYDYHGECDLVLASDPAFNGGMGLDVHVRTTIRYDYSYIESAAVKIGNDVLEVSSWGQLAFNGVFMDPLALTETSIGGFPIVYSEEGEKQKSFVLQFTENQDITLKTFKDFVNVNFNLDLPGSRGMMGEFPSGITYGRDGTTVIEDLNELGQEWQVLENEAMLFHTVRAPQAPQKCILPSVTAEESRRHLGESSVTEKQAEVACSKYSGAALENCISDVMRTGDVEMADAPGAY